MIAGAYTPAPKPDPIRRMKGGRSRVPGTSSISQVLFRPNAVFAVVFPPPPLQKGNRGTSCDMYASLTHI